MAVKGKGGKFILVDVDRLETFVRGRDRLQQSRHTGRNPTVQEIKRWAAGCDPHWYYSKKRPSA